LKLPILPNIKNINNWLLNIRYKTLIKEPIKKYTLSDITFNSKNIGEELLLKYCSNATLICCVPSGSLLHNTMGPKSTLDYIGIFAVPTVDYLSLITYPKRIDATGVSYNKNYIQAKGVVLYELNLACTLISTGNHRIIEALFYDGLLSFETPWWKELKKLRDNFITMNTVQHYISTTVSIMKMKIKTSLELYHAWRLVIEAQNLLQNKKPSLTIDTYPDLKALKFGMLELDGIEDIIKNTITEIKKNMKQSKLLKKAEANQRSTTILNSLLGLIRRELA